MFEHGGWAGGAVINNWKLRLHGSGAEVVFWGIFKNNLASFKNICKFFLRIIRQNQDIIILIIGQILFIFSYQIRFPITLNLRIRIHNELF